jgi:ATP adenylyltransferase
MQRHLFIPGKLDYCRGKRPTVDCILCAMLKKAPGVEDLRVWEDKRVVVALNLFPYNPGHLMVFPKRHLERFEEVDGSLALALHRTTTRCLKVLEKVYQPLGYNIGWNLGKVSGASIPHIHQHVVPRYAGETGFMDLVGDTRIIVEHPRETLGRMKKAFRK